MLAGFAYVDTQTQDARVGDCTLQRGRNKEREKDRKKESKRRRMKKKKSWSCRFPTSVLKHRVFDSTRTIQSVLYHQVTLCNEIEPKSDWFVPEKLALLKLSKGTPSLPSLSLCLPFLWNMVNGEWEGNDRKDEGVGGWIGYFNYLRCRAASLSQYAAQMIRQQMIPASRKCKRMVDCGRKLFRSPSLIIPVARKREREREKKIGRERAVACVGCPKGFLPSGCGDRFSRSAGVPFFPYPSPTLLLILGKLYPLASLPSLSGGAASCFCWSNRRALQTEAEDMRTGGGRESPLCFFLETLLPSSFAYRHEPSDPLKSISSFSIDLPGLHYLEGKKEDGHVGPRRWGAYYPRPPG
ncbi:uncharacterized protein CEXT_396331 [Caerostris extrusa]|uniref:Uncharacterized protein n=1 Tax=Caerostris extrusa TaxID=172846 RepID=A0AAV4RV41_CAEEX|nr:uncharacterized protein CEXT_396331 [Caerostris extrusa]